MIPQPQAPTLGTGCRAEEASGERLAVPGTGSSQQSSERPTWLWPLASLAQASGRPFAAPSTWATHGLTNQVHSLNSNPSTCPLLLISVCVTAEQRPGEDEEQLPFP